MKVTEIRNEMLVKGCSLFLSRTVFYGTFTFLMEYFYEEFTRRRDEQNCTLTERQRETKVAKKYCARRIPGMPCRWVEGVENTTVHVFTTSTEQILRNYVRKVHLYKSFSHICKGDETSDSNKRPITKNSSVSQTWN